MDTKSTPTFFKSLVGNLRNLTCKRLDIPLDVGLVSRFIEAFTTYHLKVANEYLGMPKVLLTIESLDSSPRTSKACCYCDIDWAGDVDDLKSTTMFVCFLENFAFK